MEEVHLAGDRRDGIGKAHLIWARRADHEICGLRESGAGGKKGDREICARNSGQASNSFAALHLKHHENRRSRSAFRPNP